MLTIYKKGAWAEHGRIMPGRRTVPKIIDQILIDGQVVHTSEDQKFKPQELTALLHECFQDCVKKDGRVFLPRLTHSGSSVSFCATNVHHLGGDWGPEKKRIQVSANFPRIYASNKDEDIETILLGVYHYYPNGNSGVILFVCFSPSTYAGRATNNSAAHIHTIDLLNAQKNGVYRRIDKSGNELLVLNQKNFIQYINGIRGLDGVATVEKDREVLTYFGTMYDSMPRTFLGIECFKEMMAANDKSRMNQGAWEGWYYEFYVRRYLAEHPTDKIEWWSKKGKRNLDFDLRFPYAEWFYGDVKSDKKGGDVQGNLKDSIDFLVSQNGGRLWYIVIEFVPDMDSNHDYVTTKWWNNKLKKYDRQLSYCKRMKYSIDVKRMDIYEITQDTIQYLRCLKPSDTKSGPRRDKYKIPNKLKEYLRIYERI